MPHVTQQPRRNRQRNIIWFNPPVGKNITTNIARNFLNLVDTHFPTGHKLHKIFNRKTVIFRIYTGGSKRCNLCLEEKLSILKEKSKYLLNKRPEIASVCQHKNRFQVNHLTKKGICAILTPTRPRLFFEHKNSSHVFRNLSTT